MLPRLLAGVAIAASAAVSAPAAAALPAADRYIARTWGTADGLPQNSVTSIVQTRDGYLWLGTFGGLVRFDGHAFTVFDPDNTPGLASARIVVLREDRRGVLWIGTEGGLTKYENGRFTTYTMRDGLPHFTIIALLDDSRGRLWVGTGGGLARFDGRTFERVPIDPLFPSVDALAETPDGDVWVTTRTGTARLHDDRPRIVDAPSFTTFMLVDARGRLWAASRAGLSRWEPSTSSGQGGRFAGVSASPASAFSSGVTYLAEDREGTLLIGTQQGGVYRWRDGAPFDSVSERSSDGYVRSLLQDRDGNLWIGTDIGGLVRLKPRRVFSYLHPGVAAQSIGPIVGDGADGLWIGGTCGGVRHFRAGVFDPPVMPGCVGTLLRDPDGTLWIGSAGDGLARLSQGAITRLKRDDGDRYNLVSALARDRNGRLWIGHGAGLSWFDNGVFTDVGRDAGLDHSVMCIAPDRRGALWVGTIDGLFRLAGGRVTRYTRADGLSNDYVRAIHEDADGVLWIGTYGGGLNRFKDGRFTTYGLKEGLPDTAVSRIIEDPNGNLWMSGNKGIYRVARSQLNDFADGRIAYLTSVMYGTADGMVIEETNNGFPAGWRTPDGRFWFPTIKGLVGIEPIAGPAKSPPVVIEQTVANGRPVDGGALAALGPGSVDAEFHYTAIDLGAAEKTRFRYRLVNYDPAWIDGGTRRVAYYTKVPPGTYRFEVVATDSDGAWSTAPARAAVVVIPFWWQRREANAAAAVLLVGLIVVVVRHISLRRARARVAELEREQALERERSRIARDLHDDLGSRLAQIALIAEQPAEGSADRIASVAREAMQTMDELVWTVNARNDTVERFAEFAAEFAEEHLALAGIRCRLQIQPDLENARLDADIRRHLFLGFKEAIHNAVKHARASEVRVGIGVDRGALVLEVADNGRGLPADRCTATGNGMRNMRERMEAAGGSVTAESTPGAGTRLVFRAPIGAAPPGT